MPALKKTQTIHSLTIVAYKILLVNRSLLLFIGTRKSEGL